MTWSSYQVSWKSTTDCI